MIAENLGLQRAEKRSIVWAAVIRFAGAPMSALAGFLATAMIIRATSSVQFGIINLISTSVALLPFADLGIGGIITTAAAKLTSGSDAAKHEFTATVSSALKVLGCVVLIIQLAAIVGSGLRLWDDIFAINMSRADQWIVAIVLIAFSVSIPLGLGARVLVGVGKNHIVAAMAPSISIVSVGLTFGLVLTDMPPLALSIPPLISVVLVNFVGVLIARRSVIDLGVRWTSQQRTGRRWLSGSLSMLVIMITLPIGLQSGRLIISHLGHEAALAQYSLAFQLYSAGWAAVAVGGTALWPIFVRRRAGIDVTLKLWRSALWIAALVGLFGFVLFVCFAPLASNLISGGEISVDRTLATLFGCLFLLQTVHLPSGMMLTLPSELRWQAWCSTATGLSAAATSAVLVPTMGASGAVLAAAGAILLFQVMPDLTWGGRLVRRRPAGLGSVGS